MNITPWNEFGWQFAAVAYHIGLTTSLSVICLIQYVYQKYCKKKYLEHTGSLQCELSELSEKLEDLQQIQSLFQIEIQALKEVLAEPNPDRAINALLKVFVPHPSQDFAVFLIRQQDEFQVFAQRGLSQQSANLFQIDEEFLQQLQSGTPYCNVTDSSLFQSRFLTRLTPAERDKISQLHLLAVTHDNQLFGIIATTSLLQLGMNSSKKEKLARRLIEGMSESLHLIITQLDQQLQFRLTQAKLSLRSIADEFHDTPSRLIDDFLQRLSELTSVDRATLMLITAESNQHVRVISRQGETVNETMEALWQKHEIKLTKWASKLQFSGILDQEQLRQIEVNSLMGTAFLVPLQRNGCLIGMLCLCRKVEREFTKTQNVLADWSGDFLANTMMRMIDRTNMERQANFDGLTELANRRTFDERLGKELEIAKNRGHELSLCLLDLDRFKSINDQYGHRAGDEVLRQFSQLLTNETKKVRSTDRLMVARYGGEEMAIILPEISLQGAVRIAESIRESTRNMTILFEGQQIQVTVSIGIANFPQHSFTDDELLEFADNALYHAKRNGRNRVMYYSQHEESLHLLS